MNDHMVAFVVLMYSVSVGAQQNPVISFISKERVVDIGGHVALHCTVLYSDNYPVLWTRFDSDNPSNTFLISKDISLIVPHRRYSISYNRENATYTLLISKIQEIDAGLYQCQIILGPVGKITADVYVFVRIPPVISDNSTSSVMASSGTTVLLFCYARGCPKPRISWRREKNELLPTGHAVFEGNILTIPNVTKYHRGTYYCVADNGVGKGARRNIGVEVEFAPVITIDRKYYGQALQYDMDLQCHIEAFPSPSVIWMKDGVQLNNNQHYHISLFSTADEFTDSTLRVITVEKKQYGNYTCKAMNKLGSDEKNIELIETVNIICPPACGLNVVSVATCSQVSVFSIVWILLTLFHLK
ncbi:lachesin-like [Tachypleus tridentatus]|uniref:lachesin-like n=1 Tax=Tachypleus tridentatus TaxID=6853 RepID=UPI003FD5E184